MTLLHGSTLLTARTAFFISLRMARHLSSRQGAGAQEYGLYFKLLQRSIGGRDPAYAVAFDRCNGRYPSCSSQAARKWYGPCPWRGAFSRGRPSLWPRKNSFFFVTAFLKKRSLVSLLVYKHFIRNILIFWNRLIRAKIPWIRQKLSAQIIKTNFYVCFTT